MNKHSKPILLIQRRWVYLLVTLLFITLNLTACADHPSILNPKGVIAFEEREIMFNTVALMLIVVWAVIIMSFVFVYNYREGNNKAEYKPEWCHSVLLESIWWGVPCVIISIIAAITWVSTHKLDPYQKVDYPGEVMRVEVVALPWKWLFIYPEYDIATINYLALPNKRQVEFYLTTDNVPMSSFIIPQLGSQIYAMAGMQTKLHLVPTQVGRIKGFNTQYNGEGFSKMNFDVDVLEASDFSKWTSEVKSKGNKLSNARYVKVRQETFDNSQGYFKGIEPKLFHRIIMSYNGDKHPLSPVMSAD
jgi:cytochrome o ubiquinol oxidase subunit 2